MSSSLCMSAFNFPFHHFLWWGKTITWKPQWVTHHKKKKKKILHLQTTFYCSCSCHLIHVLFFLMLLRNFYFNVSLKDHFCWVLHHASHWKLHGTNCRGLLFVLPTPYSIFVLLPLQVPVFTLHDIHFRYLLKRGKKSALLPCLYVTSSGAQYKSPLHPKHRELFCLPQSSLNICCVTLASIL